MLNRILCIIMSLVLMASMCACGAENNAPEPEKSTQTPEIIQPIPLETQKPTEPEANYEILCATANTWVNSIGTTWVQVIIEVENTGAQNLFISGCAYDLEDENGSLIAVGNTSAYPQVLAPGEKTALYDATTLDTDVEGELRVIPHEDIVAAKVDMIRYPVSDFSLSDGKYGGVDMIGRVENTGSEEESLVYVVVNLYDAGGKCIGQIMTIVNKIKPAEKIGFDGSEHSLPPSVRMETIATYEVFAFKYQFQF